MKRTMTGEDLGDKLNITTIKKHTWFLESNPNNVMNKCKVSGLLSESYPPLENFLACTHYRTQISLLWRQTTQIEHSSLSRFMQFFLAVQGYQEAFMLETWAAFRELYVSLVRSSHWKVLTGRFNTKNTKVSGLPIQVNYVLYFPNAHFVKWSSNVVFRCLTERCWWTIRPQWLWDFNTASFPS